jgi:hypothetical protein
MGVTSQTIYEGSPIPRWARYGVVICHSCDRVNRPEKDVIQVFGSRFRAECFARDISGYFPGRDTGNVASGNLTMWALVYAFPSYARDGASFGAWACCYYAVDPGGVCLKYHDILKGYGVPASNAGDRAYSRGTI